MGVQWEVIGGQRKVSGQSWEVNEGFLEVSGRSRGCHWRSLRGYMLIVKGNGQERKCPADAPCQRHFISEMFNSLGQEYNILDAYAMKQATTSTGCFLDAHCQKQ